MPEGPNLNNLVEALGLQISDKEIFNVFPIDFHGNQSFQWNVVQKEMSFKEIVDKE